MFYERQGRCILRAGPTRPPLLLDPALLPPVSLRHLLQLLSLLLLRGGVRVVTIPTVVSRRKVRTAGVACPSWKSSLTVGACGCFHSQAFPTPLQAHISGYVAQGEHLMDRW